MRTSTETRTIDAPPSWPLGSRLAGAGRPEPGTGAPALRRVLRRRAGRRARREAEPIVVSDRDTGLLLLLD